MQLAALVAQGQSNKQIGDQLHLQYGTVKVYLSRIFPKLGITNRTELALWYVRKHPEPTETGTLPPQAD